MTTPQKDIVYIDVEDDITAIIGKLKKSKHNIVALVPPKRIGVMQSAVNLRLLARAAGQHDKRLVLITSNSSLAGLAAAAKIPVAKNLQSKPELGEIAALDVDDGDEVIDGADLPVGEHARQAEGGAALAAATALGVAATSDAAATTDSEADAAKPKAKKSQKVPNFDLFRKKLFLIIAGVIALVGLLIWAIIFAPHARVILSTRTIDASVSQQVTLGTGLETNAANATIQAERQTLTEEVSIPFDATGKKNVGEKATGTVELSQQSIAERTVPSGTRLESSGGFVFVTNSAVTIPASTIGLPDCFPTACAGTASVDVTAAQGGADYNAQSGSLSGEPAGVQAVFSSATSGGTDKTVATVTQKDIDAAKKQVSENIDDATARQSLAKQFEEGVIVLADSFTTNTKDIKASVSAGEEAPSGKAQLVGDVTHTLYGVTKEQLDSYLKTVVTEQIDDVEQQRVYDSGADDAEFSDVESVEQGVSATLSANGALGPRVDEAQVRDIAAGKNYGEIQAELEAINGVESVDTKFSPFWVSRAPSNINKISVEFKLNE